MRSARGGRIATPSGRPIPSPIMSPAGVITEQLPNQCFSTSPPVASSPPDVTPIACEFQGSDEPLLCALPPAPSNQESSLDISPCREKGDGSHRPCSPPPVLRSSIQLALDVPSRLTNTPHSILVDNVSNSLVEEDMDEDGSQDDESSGEDDDEDMSEEALLDVCPDDDMTLYKYQAEARREALVRKGSNIHNTSPKKWRLGLGEPCSEASLIFPLLWKCFSFYLLLWFF